MFEVLTEPAPAVVAIRVGDCSPAGFRDLYRLLSATTDAHDTVNLYGSTFDIGRYAAVGDSVWARGLFDCWRAIAPVWPVSPDEMQYFGPAEREAARSWVRTGELPGDRGRATQ
ncbi:STAS/SEC14 domain-containing protein [Halomicrobium sp. IBSBa]|nr:STAS/SEC14 domain-containing protein [Halomicrobium sp. IBSBa]